MNPTQKSLDLSDLPSQVLDLELSRSRPRKPTSKTSQSSSTEAKDILNLDVPQTIHSDSDQSDNKSEMDKVPEIHVDLEFL